MREERKRRENKWDKWVKQKEVKEKWDKQRGANMRQREICSVTCKCL